MLKMGNEEILARVFYSLLCKEQGVEQELFRSALFAIMGIPSQDYPQSRLNLMNKRFIIFYLNKMEHISSQHTQAKKQGSYNMNSIYTKHSGDNNEFLQKIYEACGQSPTVTDLFTIMKQIDKPTLNNIIPKKSLKHKTDINKTTRQNVKTRKAILEVEINIEDEIKEKCLIYEGDTSLMVIKRLTEKYNLNDEEQEIIYKQLKGHF